MLNTLRASSHGIVAKILLGLICLSFVVWGIGDVIRNPDRNRALASVGSSAITTDQFLRSLHSETENIRRMMGDNYSPEALKGMNVEGFVLQNLINHRLLQLESVNLGLIPADIDVVRRVRSNQSFQDSKGNFDKAIFESALHNSNMTEKLYVDQLREEMGINILLDSLASGMPQSEIIAPTLLHTREEGRQISLYALNDSVVTGVGTPDNDAIKEYYDANPRQFTAPELREFSFVTISADNVPKNSEGSEEALRAAYNERMDEYKRPERRIVEQLLYSSEAQAQKASDMLKSGKSLTETASKIEPLNKNSLTMGKVEKHNIFDNAAESVFSMKIGEVTPPLQSPFGWHLYSVTAIEPPSVAPFEEVRTTLEKEMQQRNNDEALNKLANKIEDALAAGSSLSEAATEFKLKLVAISPLDAEGKDASGKTVSLPVLDKLLQTVFKTEEKAESPVMTSKGGVFYIVRTENTSPEHIRPLEEVRSAVVKGWQQQQRAIKLAEMAKKAGEEFAGSAAKPALVSKYKLQSVGRSVIKRSSRATNELSLPPQLVTDVFSIKSGEGTNAYMTTNGTYLLAIAENVVPITSPEKDPRLTAALVEIKRNLQSVRQNEIVEEYTQYLRSKYAVKVHEDVLQAVMN